MGLRSEVQAILLGSVLSTNVRYQTQPAGAVGVTIADDAAWDQLFVAATVTVDYWIAGLLAVILAPGADAGLLVDVGTGGADGAAVTPATVLITDFPLFEDFISGVGAHEPKVVFLPIPIRVAASTRSAAQIGASPTGTDAIDQFSLVLITGLGT